MIKAAGETGLGIPLLFLGLSGENVARLAAGEPIRVSAKAMSELGLPAIEIVLGYGRTEAVLVEELNEHGFCAVFSASGPVRAAMTLRAGKRGAAGAAPICPGRAGLLKLSLEAGDGHAEFSLPLKRCGKPGLQRRHRGSVDSLAELLLPLRSGHGHLPSVSAC
jgi:hypothetical protein